MTAGAATARFTHAADRLLVLVLCLMGSVAACSRSTPAVQVTSTSTITTTLRPTTTRTGPLSTAAVTEQAADSCPYISRDTASSDAGYRLDRITSLIQGGQLVGCRFYALQHPTADCDEACLQAEKLPPATVPGVEIRLTKYSSPLTAYNAFVKTADAGTDYQQVEIGPGDTGVCYRTTVWAADGGKDWACAFSKAVTAVVIRSVVTNSAFNVVQIATAVSTTL